MVKMKKITTELLQIKKTKSVEMYADEHTGFKGLWIYIYFENDKGSPHTLFIPKNKVFQLQRGIISYLQRFWRKK